MNVEVETNRIEGESFVIARYRMSELTQSEQDRILRRAGSDISAQMEVAREICDTVRREGDTALYAYTEAFDGVRLNPGSMRVTEEEIREATAQVDERTAETLRYAAGNIRRFHEAQMPEPMWMMEVDQGIMAGEKVTAIPDVALYVPRGKGSFPSVLLMLGTPAVVAGVARIIVLTPPNEVGKVDPAILFSADLLGIREIYKVGGAQAIAAVAYGTETVPKCAKVLGPGNPYVTAAKRLVMGAIDPGVPAGPSEAIILTDGSIDPRLVAHDVLIEAEHGPDSAALVVTWSAEVADAVEAQLRDLMAQIETPMRRSFVETVMRRYGGIVECDSKDEAIDFVNRYAPEHMEILTVDPWAILPRIKHAGEILMGEHTPITLCNFLLGPNAILPTGQMARTVSAVSLHDFLKRSSIGYVTKEGFQKVAPYAAHFADLEGFEMHAKAVRGRMK